MELVKNVAIGVAAAGLVGFAAYKMLNKPSPEAPEEVLPPLTRQESSAIFFGNLTPEERQVEEAKLKLTLKTRMFEDIEALKGNNIVEVEHLSDWCGIPEEVGVNPLLFKAEERHRLGMPPESFVEPGTFCIKDYQFNDEEELKVAKRYMKAGPKEYIYFNKDEVCAAIVTCGGLCPGLNVVIREIVMSLWWNYKIRKIWGVRWGYHGFFAEGDNYIPLTPEKVKDIHHLGGTILGAGRDVFKAKEVLDAIVARGINQVYVIGGDGTHKGLQILAEEIKKRKLRIALVGVPKTIDNDIKIIDYSFGFSSAVQAAVKAIESGNVEALCAENGVGLIKVMGRDVGHIATHASLASRDVNICLVPEFKFDMYGDKGLLNYLFETRFRVKSHCVIVVAEGAALGVNDVQLVEEGKDPRSVDIGGWLKKQIEKYAAEHNQSVIIKYIDPSYMIRTVPANSADRQFCSSLAQNAVHGAMAGFTNFTCGIIRGVSVNLPIHLVAEGEKNKMDYEDRGWQRLLANTGQPTFRNDVQGIIIQYNVLPINIIGQLILIQVITEWIQQQGIRNLEQLVKYTPMKKDKSIINTWLCLICQLNDISFMDSYYYPLEQHLE
eukprot:TRINITY_DN3399_c2_g1_i1.p1 TRINITY_DN3399_c2_g1~~TRINITY_DN3399_c2_g1_i1.p1  ORF type:complete len:607 (-),score=64.22 TRINITY_DN3399_c2_g1_i1:3008-4828(-)